MRFHDLGATPEAGFHGDIETCSECGGTVKVIDCIEDPVVIKKILGHLREKAEATAHTCSKAGSSQPACSTDKQNRSFEQGGAPCRGGGTWLAGLSLWAGSTERAGQFQAT
jgi:hypothetical protein